MRRIGTESVALLMLGLAALLRPSAASGQSLPVGLMELRDAEGEFVGTVVDVVYRNSFASTEGGVVLAYDVDGKLALLFMDAESKPRLSSWWGWVDSVVYFTGAGCTGDSFVPPGRPATSVTTIMEESLIVQIGPGGLIVAGDPSVPPASVSVASKSLNGYCADLVAELSLRPAQVVVDLSRFVKPFSLHSGLILPRVRQQSSVAR